MSREGENILFLNVEPHTGQPGARLRAWELCDGVSPGSANDDI